jgi:polysaccharide biosynthesis transport protein
MIQYSKLDSPMSPHSFLGVLSKRRKLILIMFAVIVVSIVGSTFLMPKIYRASTMVYVKYLPNIQDLYLNDNMSPTTVKVDYELLETEVKYVQNRNILNSVANHFGLLDPQDETLDEDGLRTFKDRAVYEFGQGLKVEREKDTNILSINYEHENPAFAANVVDRIAEEYIKQRPNLERDETAYKFFDDELKEIETQIDKLERKQLSIKGKSNVLIPEEQTEILFSKMAHFDEELTKVRAERISKEARLNSILRAFEKDAKLFVPITETSESLAKQDYVNHLRKSLSEKTVYKQGLVTKYTDNHPEVVQLTEEISEIEMRIKMEIEDVVRGEQLLIESLKAQEGALAHSMEKVVVNIASLAKSEYELKKSSMSLEDLRHVNSMLVRQREQARITANRNEYSAQVRLLEAAMVPFDPIKPNKPLYAALAILLGVVVSIGLAFFLEYFDHSVNTAEDAQNCLGLPILAQIKDFQMNTSNRPGHGSNGDGPPSEMFNREFANHNQN